MFVVGNIIWPTVVAVMQAAGGSAGGLWGLGTRI